MIKKMKAKNVLSRRFAARAAQLRQISTYHVPTSVKSQALRGARGAGR